MGGLDAGGEIERAGFAGSDAHDDGVGRIAGEDLAAVLNAAQGEPGGGDAGIEIERAPVAGDAVGRRKGDIEIAECLVGALVEGLAHELLHGEVFGLFLLAGPEQFADLRQVPAGALVSVVVGLTGPDGVLVKLDAPLAGPAKDHGAHAAVADGQGVGPDLCRLVIPEGVLGEGGADRDNGS